MSYGPTDRTQFVDAIGVLARALSHGRRTGAQLTTGPHRAFGTNLEIVFVPHPFDEWVGPSQIAAVTVGIALQSAPSKDAIRSLPLEDLSWRDAEALRVVEGGAASSWVAQRWPGLVADLAESLHGVEPQSGDLTAGQLLERARRMPRGHPKAPALLGSLPRPTRSDAAQGSGIERGRLPWSIRRLARKVWTPQLIQIAVAGNDGPKSMRDGSPEIRDEDERALLDRPIGIPYDEWDVTTGRYRLGFVTVVEYPQPTCHPRADAPLPELLSWFRRSPDRHHQGGLTDGTDLDIDRVVAAHVGRRRGDPPEDRLYRGLVESPRDVATALLIDSSSSLSVRGGQSRRLQLECADALAVALAEDGQPHGVFAFAGHTRHQVRVHVLRGFAETGMVLPSQSGSTPDGYTRLGAALRHVAARLREVRVTRRVLIVMGDGLVSDEGYEGRYAVADVTKAAEEAAEDGIVLCYVAVGTAANEPLHDAFGHNGLVRTQRLEQLPTVLAEVHDRLSAA